MHEGGRCLHIIGVNTSRPATAPSRELIELFDEMMHSAAASTEAPVDSAAMRTEILSRTARMKVETIRVAATAFGATSIPASRSGAVKALVTQWALASARGGNR